MGAYGSRPDGRSRAAIAVLLATALCTAFVSVTSGAFAQSNPGTTYFGNWTDFPPLGNGLSGISALDSTHAWAVGGKGGVVYSNGKAWRDQATPTTADLNSVFALDTSHVWAVGSSGTICFYDGSSWTEQYAHPAYVLTCVTAVDADHAWAAGYLSDGAYPENGVVLSFDGTAWTRASVPGLLGVNSIDAHSVDCVWTAGDNGQIFYFDGSSWHPQHAAVTDDTWAISVLAPDNVWIIAGYDSRLFQFNGSSWVTKMKGPDVRDHYGSPYKLEVLDATHIWVGARNLTGDYLFDDGYVCSYTGAGDSWDVLVAGGTEGSYTPIDFSLRDDSCIWVLGNGSDMHRYDLVGSPFTYRELIVRPAEDIVSFSGAVNSAWICDSYNKIYFSDGGDWVRQRGNGGETIRKIYAFDPAHVWAVGDRGLLLFFDGSRWSRQDPGTTSNLRDVIATDPAHVWAVGDGVYFFNGKDWRVQEPASELSGLQYVTAWDSNHLWAGDGSRLFSSDGVSWSYMTDSTDRWYSTGPDTMATVRGDQVCYMDRTGTHVLGAQPRFVPWIEQTQVLQSYINGFAARAPDELWVILHTDVSMPDGRIRVNNSYSEVMRFDGTVWQTVHSSEMTSPVFNDYRALCLARSYRTYALACNNILSRGIGESVTSRTWAQGSAGVTEPATTWYLSEGSTGPGFETWILVENPGDQPAGVALTFMTPGGAVKGPSDTVGPRSRKSYEASKWVPDQWSVSTQVNSNRPVVAERATYGNGRQWATGSIGAVAPATTWYMPEGSTGPGFETWVLVQNPGDGPVTAHLTFMTPEGAVDGPTEKLAPGTRRTYNVAQWVPDRWEVATTVTADGAVVAERSTYGDGRRWATGYVGASSAQNNWYLPEGSTGPGFETWVLIENPGDGPTHVDVTFMTPDGAVKGPSDTLAPRSRKTYEASDWVPNQWSVSTQVTFDRPAVAERVTYGNGRYWASDSMGAHAAGQTWYLPEGSTGQGFETWVLLQNPGDRPASVTLTFMTPDGAVGGPTETLEAGTRRTYNVSDWVPDCWEVATIVTSDRPVVAENTMYGDPH